MCRLPGRRARVGACIIALLFPSLLASPASAAAGALDPTFGGDGVVTTDVGPGTDVGVAVAIQADGKAVMVGVAGVDRRNSRFGVTRYDDDGTLDATFGGGDGKVVTDLTRGYDEADAVAIQDDGKIVVAGLAGERLGLARYGTGGGLDPSFGGDGRVTTDLSRARDFAYAVGIQDDGKIVAAGYVGGAGGRFAVVRYESDGSLDGTFGGGDGWAAVDFSPGYDYADDLAIQADGKIILAGAANYFGTRGRVALARFDTTGSLDPGFGGGDGKVASDLGPGFDAVYAVAIQPTDEKILAAGQAGERLAVLRYDTSGVPDPTFGGDGVARVDFTRGLDYADEVVIQADGTIVAAGATDFYGRNAKFAMVRYGSNGVLDTSFSGDGKVVTNISPRRDGAYGLAIQPDGKLVASGYAKHPVDSRFALVRYLAA